MTVAMSVRQSSPFAWLHRRNRAVTSASPVSRDVARAPAAYAANPDRWAALPGEYADADADAPRTVTRILPASGASALIACVPDGATAVHLGGAWHGRVHFEQSEDGLCWQPVTLLSFDRSAPTAEAIRPGLWRTPPHRASRFLRVRVGVLTHGAVALSMTDIPPRAANHPARLDHAA